MFNKKPIKASVFANGADENGNRYGNSGWKGTLDIKAKFGIDKYKIHDGRNLIDIVPFNAGKAHPLVMCGKCEEGETVYSLDYFVHKSIGPGQADYTCLAQYGQNCPICAESKRYYQKGDDDSKKKGGALRARRRVVYLVHDLIDGNYYYWDTGWKSFEDPINKRARITIDPETQTAVNPFDWEHGKTISFYGVKDKFNGHDYIKISDGTFDFVARETLSDEVLSHSVDLSEAIIVPTEEQLDAALAGKPTVAPAQTAPVQQSVSQPAPATDTLTQDLATQAMEGSAPVAQAPAEPVAPAQPAAPAQPTPAPVQQAAPVQAAPVAAGGDVCPFGHNWGESDRHPECKTCQAWIKCIDATPRT